MTQSATAKHQEAAADSPRILPLPFEEWSKDAHDAFALLAPAASKGNGTNSNLIMTLAHHGQLAKAFYTFSGHLLLNSTLAPRPRELATLRVGWRYKAEYEWYQHVRLAKRIGITDEEIDAVKEGAETAGLPEADRCILRATDELCEQSRIDDATWAELNRHFDRSAVMDLVFTVGNYVTLSWALNTFGIRIEPEVIDSRHPLT
jgi:4-carboxymuconolactone decarboxylase